MSHPEEPGPDVPDDILADMKEVLLGPPEPSLSQDESTQLFPPPLTGPVLLTTLVVPLLGLLPAYVFPGSRTQNQTQYSRYS